jgi:hypothetical protein
MLCSTNWRRGKPNPVAQELKTERKIESGKHTRSHQIREPRSTKNSGSSKSTIKKQSKSHQEEQEVNIGRKVISGGKCTRSPDPGGQVHQNDNNNEKILRNKANHTKRATNKKDASVEAAPAIRRTGAMTARRAGAGIKSRRREGKGGRRAQRSQGRRPPEATRRQQSRESDREERDRWKYHKGRARGGRTGGNAPRSIHGGSGPTCGFVSSTVMNFTAPLS